MVLKVNSDPDCPGVGCAPDDCSLTNFGLVHDATRSQGLICYGFSHISGDRWREIFGDKSSSSSHQSAPRASAQGREATNASQDEAKDVLDYAPWYMSDIGLGDDAKADPPTGRLPNGDYEWLD